MTIQPNQIHDQRYRFERIIGQGAFGVTWRGEHLKLHRPVAIKVIDATKLDPANLERVIRECQIGGQLNNAHIVNVLDAYEQGNDLCIVMEFMAGGSLKDYLAQHRPSLPQGLRWALDLTEALAAVHEQGIIHRDVKPANLLLTETNEIKIADFGIAHLPGSDLTGAYQPGTPAYRSPEQEQNQPVDAATDVYALCAVLFQLFTGEKFAPFKGVTWAEWRGTLHRRLARSYPQAPASALDSLAEALAGGLRVDKTTRSSLAELQQTFATILNELPTTQTNLTPPPPGSGSSTTVWPSAPAPPASSAADQTPISKVGRYELQALIGRGGMGAVYQAYDPNIGRMVALKTITIVDPSWRARFQQEVRIAGGLNHPHIVTVYDVGEAGEIAYIVMELIEGQTLADLLPSRLAWTEAVRLLLPVCQALTYAHQQGVVHRDVKPANILLAADERIKLTDFGIARQETAKHLTQTGSVVGTPLYMAPEQLAGQKAVDSRADVFALGVILFELIAGQNPFAGEESSPGWQLMISRPPADFSLLAELAPPSVQEIIRRAMAHDAGARFAAVVELSEALSAALSEATATAAGDAPSTATGPTLPLVDLSSGVRLQADERDLLVAAFSGYERLYLESELSGPSEGGRLLVVLPIHSGRPLARVIVKIASPEILSREWKAFQEYVADILPLVTGHIQGAPLLSPDRKLGLLRYTFAGDVGDQQAQSLAAYYESHTALDLTTLLERNIFQAIAPTWWLNRETYRFTVRQEYERLLPVHLVIEHGNPSDPAPLILKAGVATAQEVRHLEPGRAVHLQGFRIQAIQQERRELILEAPTAAGRAAEQLRLRLTELPLAELRFQPGDLAPDLGGTVIATRRQLLTETIRTAVPQLDLSQPLLTIGTSSLSNPLHHYEGHLDRSVSGMRSIIHGQLTLESILVEPESGVTWLINFAQTRSGHNLYDFLQLEAEVVTRLLPLQVDPARGPLDDEIVAMARMLHTSSPPPTAPHPLLQKPYELLRTIRRLVGQCMLDPAKWDEYYLGLELILLGRLPAYEAEPATARLTFAWASVAGELVDRTLRPAVEIVPPVSRSKINYLWLGVGLIGILGLMTGGPYLVRTVINPTPTPTPLPIVVAPSPTNTPPPTDLPTDTPVPTATSTSTPSPTPTPGAMAGEIIGDLNVFGGPGTNYPFVASISKGLAVQVIGRDVTGNWWHISWPGGEGWVEAPFVNVEATPNLPLIAAAPPPTFTPTPTNTHTPTLTPTPVPPTPTITRTPLPTGSPTAAANASRNLVSNTLGYQVLDNQAMAFNDPTSAAFSPNGGMIAATEGIKLYTIRTDGTDPFIWVEEDGDQRPVESIVWSPNGALIAFVADRKRDCSPPACGRVGIIVTSDPGKEPIYLNPPAGHGIRLPRWTQDGRLLVTIHQSDLDTGTVYVYDAGGRGQVAQGNYLLSSSVEGQKWSPWLPGKNWTVDPSRPTSYYTD